MQAFLLLIATLIILLTTNWQLTVSILPILPVTIVLFAIFGRIAQPLFEKSQRLLSALNTVLQENVAGIRVVKSFVREGREQERFDEATNVLMRQRLHISRTFSVLFPVIFLLATLARLLFFTLPACKSSRASSASESISRSRSTSYTSSFRWANLASLSR